MKADELFVILDSVGSTNNYAMAKLHEGMANNGQAWFSANQTEGKGQRNKSWYSRPGQNIALSIVFRPGPVFQGNFFLFNAFLANEIINFLRSKFAPHSFTIKWPNDIYWNDRKAGGILIENIISGQDWQWSVVGIGLNVNQETFPPVLPNPVSLSQVTGRAFDVEGLAKVLYKHLLNVYNAGCESFPQVLHTYNEILYKNGKQVKLKKDNVVFKTTVRGVNEFGQLITEDSLERKFSFGEVEWIIPA
ncbi:MAG: biotin--[acetyl-CoA-carboxylase] ligase [Ferruginibacter sp.]